MAIDSARNDSTISPFLLIHGACTSPATAASWLFTSDGSSPATSTQICSVEPCGPTPGSKAVSFTTHTGRPSGVTFCALLSRETVRGSGIAATRNSIPLVSILRRISPDLPRCGLQPLAAVLPMPD